MYLDFISSHTLTQNITGIGPFICWDVKDGSLVTTTSLFTKSVGRFGNLWLVCTGDLTLPLTKISGWPTVVSKP